MKLLLKLKKVISENSCIAEKTGKKDDFKYLTVTPAEGTNLLNK